MILAVAKILAAVRTEHTFTALTAEMAAVERFMVAEAEITRAGRADLMLTYRAGIVTATKFGVILAVTKITKTSHALPVLTVLAGEVSAIKLGVISR